MGSLDSAYEEHITCFLVPKAGQRRWVENCMGSWMVSHDYTAIHSTPSHVNYSALLGSSAVRHGGGSDLNWHLSRMGSHYWCFRDSTGEAAQISVARIAQPVPHTGSTCPAGQFHTRVRTAGV